MITLEDIYRDATETAKAVWLDQMLGDVPVEERLDAVLEAHRRALINVGLLPDTTHVKLTHTRPGAKNLSIADAPRTPPGAPGVET